MMRFIHSLIFAINPTKLFSLDGKCCAIWKAPIRSVMTLALVIAINGQSLEAITIALYDAGTAGNPATPPDPVSASGGSWTLDSGTTGTSAGPILDDSGLGLNAWQIIDESSINRSFHSYSIAVTPTQINNALANGWQLDGRLRIVEDDFDASRTYFLLFDDGSKRWSFIFDLDTNNDLIVTPEQNGGNTSFALTSDGSGAALYHDYSLVYNPLTGLASFFFDGALQTASYSGATSIFVFDLVFFGSGSSLGQGIANFNRIEFQINPAPSTSIPEPSTSLSFLLGIAGFAVMCYRNHKAKSHTT